MTAILRLSATPPPDLPSGVQLQDPDGGTNYYGTNGFTKTTAFPTTINYAGNSPPDSPGSVVTYTNGWDDPKFFPISVWLTVPQNQGDVDRWLYLGINTLFGMAAPYSGVFDLLKNNGISFIWNYNEGGALINNDRMPDSETVAILGFDEPDLFGSVQTSSTIPLEGQGAVTMTNVTFPGASGSSYVDIAGSVTGGAIFMGAQYPNTYAQPDFSGGGLPAHCWVVQNSSAPQTGGPGTYVVNSVMRFSGASFSGATITQAAISPIETSIITGRYFAVNYAGFLGLRFNSMNSYPGSNTTISAHLAQTYTAQDGRSDRRIEATGTDNYHFPVAFDNPGAITNVYNVNGGTTWSYSDAAKGNRYGDCIDFMRALCGSHRIPITQAIDNSSALYGGPSPWAYDTQPVEMNWSAWSIIIHGARGILWFNHVGGETPSGCAGFGTGGDDNTKCTFMQSAQTATFTGTLDGAGNLTIFGTPTGNGVSGTGRVARGMRATSGVTGTCIVLEQTSNFNTPGYSTDSPGTTFKVAGTAGAQSGTFTFKQSQVGFGLSAISMAGIGASSAADAGMTAAIKIINDTVRTMAPVINSKFAVATSAGNGYLKFTTSNLRYCFPSNTGVHDTTAAQTLAFGELEGIDACVHYYEGPTYTSLMGDTISAGFYIFATTAHPSQDTNISCTFKIADMLATSVTPLGEGRGNITVSGGQFTDTFDYAWTVHIYRVNH